jgi:hypothetical protein
MSKYHIVSRMSKEVAIRFGRADYRGEHRAPTREDAAGGGGSPGSSGISSMVSPMRPSADR